MHLGAVYSFLHYLKVILENYFSLERRIVRKLKPLPMQVGLVVPMIGDLNPGPASLFGVI